MKNTTNHGILVVCRHAESEWNALGVWTGLTDVSLSAKGHADAQLLGEELRDIQFSAAYTSNLIRTHQTLEGILSGKKSQSNLAKHHHAELNERDYGELTGKNKWEVREAVGEENFKGIRRGWAHPVPGGETLKDVHDRAVPFFDSVILPRLHRGENILIVAHGNTIRALMKHLENIEESKMADVEMPFDNILVYHFSPISPIPHKKTTRTIATTKTFA